MDGGEAIKPEARARQQKPFPLVTQATYLFGGFRRDCCLGLLSPIGMAPIGIMGCCTVEAVEQENEGGAAHTCFYVACSYVVALVSLGTPHSPKDTLGDSTDSTEPGDTEPGTSLAGTGGMEEVRVKYIQRGL